MPNTLLHKRGTSKPSPSDLLVGEIAINTAEGKLFTENDSGYIWEAGELLGTFSGTTITYTVTVASKTSAHRYNGQGSSLGYKINGVFSPFLTLTPGNTYRFDQSNSSNSNHPLKFYLEADKSTLYSTNVTINGTAGQSGAYTEITISDTTPLVLHYQCGFHGYMGNAVFCNSKTVNYNDLQNKPSLFSGNYNDLSNKPSLFSGNYNDLSNKPSLFSGSYNDLSNKPTIPTLTSQLTNDSGFITSGGGGLTDGDKGDIVVSNSGDTLTVDSGVIDNANIASNAAIAGSKIDPNFGSQTITTKKIQVSGHAAIQGTTHNYKYGRGGEASGVSVYAMEAALELVGTDSSTHAGSLLLRSTADGAGFVYNPTDDALELKLFTSSANDFSIHGSGTNVSDLDTQIRIVKNAQVELAHNGTVKIATSSSGVDITGNITATGTIDGVLKNGVTATTQSAGDNSTKIATTAYTDTAIANLADSAPSTLNTLNELAAALGDDANFSTTVTNSIATKLPLAGGTMSGNLTITRPVNTNNTLTLGGSGAYSTFIKLLCAGAGGTQIESSGRSDGGNRLEIKIGSGVVATFNENGNIAVSGLVDGRDLASDGAKLDGIATGATNVTNNNQLTNGAGYITSASLAGVSDGGNAASLDGIDSSQFLRSDQNDTFSGDLTGSSGSNIKLDGNMGTAGTTTFNSMSGYLEFTNDYNDSARGANKIRLQTDNNWLAGFGISANSHDIYTGGNFNFYKSNSTTSFTNLATLNSSGSLSTSTQGVVWGASNDGAGSGLDADKLDGQQGSHYLDYNNFSNTPTIPTNNNQLTNGAGYITSAALAGASDGGNAALLDGIDSTQFLRADQDDTTTGKLTLGSSANEKLVLSGSSNPFIRWFEGTTNKAYIQWSSSGYLWLQNEEDSSVIVLRDNLGFSPDGGSTIHKIFHAGNDGSGSGLDADTVDGIQASSFVRSDASDTLSGNYTFSSTHASLAKLIVTGISSSSGYNYLLRAGNDAGNKAVHFVNGSTRTADGGANTYTIRNDGGALRLGKDNQSTLLVGSGDLTYNGNEVWHAGNDGSGSGLDADKLDGVQASSFLRSDTSDGWSGTLTNSSRNEDPSVSNGAINLQPSTNGGRTGIVFRSQVNSTSDHAYIWWYDDLNAYRINDSTENGVLLIGIQNDASNAGSSDAIAIESSGDIFLNAGIGTGVRGANSWDSTKGNVYVGNAATKYKVFHEGNDGTGSGLDADTVDGIQASSFLRSDASNTLSTIITGHASNTEVFRVRSSSYSDKYIYIGGWSTSNSNNIGRIRSSSNLHIDSPANGHLYLNWYASNRSIYLGNTGQAVYAAGGNSVWHSANDGSGSGLDADTLDGVQASGFFRQSGSWAGDLTSNGFTRENGMNMTGGAEFVLLSKSGQGHVLIDGSYHAYEGGAFYSYQNSNFSSQVGFYADSTSSARWKGHLKPNANSSQDLGSSSLRWRNIYADTMSGNLSLHGNLLLTGSPTTTNQSRMIDFTGFDKESTGDFTDRAYIQHTINTGGLSGSVLVISSRNDANDGINFDTANNNCVKINGNTVWNDGNDGSGSGLDADKLDGYQASDFARKSETVNFTSKKVGLGTGLSGGFSGRNAALALGDSDTGVAQNGDGQLELWANNQECVNIDTSRTIHYKELCSTQNVVAYYSDERLKEKLGSIQDALVKVNQIETFFYRENKLAKEFGFNKDDKQLGVSAQSVEKVVPEVVALAPFDYEVADDGSVSSKSGKDYKTVDYGRLVPLLIESIKELTNKVKVLENKLNVE